MARHETIAVLLLIVAVVAFAGLPAGAVQESADDRTTAGPAAQPGDGAGDKPEGKTEPIEKPGEEQPAKVLLNKLCLLEAEIAQHAEALKAERAGKLPDAEKVKKHEEALQSLREILGKVRKEIAENTKCFDNVITLEDYSRGLPARTSPKQAWNGMFRTNPAIGDVNNDGLLDVAAVSRLSPEQGVWVWLNDGKGGWKKACNGLPRGGAGGGLVFADINKDGNLDLVAGLHMYGVRCWFGDGKGNWTEKSNGLISKELQRVTGDSMDVAVADFNEDGHLDIAFAGWMSHTGTHIFAGDSKGNWKEMKNTGLPMDLRANKILATDINNDGHADIVVTLGGHWWLAGRNCDPVWIGDGKGHFRNASIGIKILKTGAVWGVAVADVNKDGCLDLALAGGPNLYSMDIQVFLGNARGVWRRTVKDVGVGYCKDIEFGDFNGDGNLDLASARGGKILILRGDGEGNFEWMETIGLAPVPSKGSGMAVADIDGDGISDVLAGFGHEEYVPMFGAKPIPSDAINGGGWVKVYCPRPTDVHLKKRMDSLKKQMDDLLGPEPPEKQETEPDAAPEKKAAAPEPKPAPRARLTDEAIRKAVKKNVNLLSSRFYNNRNAGIQGLILLGPRATPFIKEALLTIDDDRARGILIEVLMIMGDESILETFIDIALDPKSPPSLVRGALVGVDLCDPWGEKLTLLAEKGTAEKIEKTAALMKAQENLREAQFKLGEYLNPSLDFHNNAEVMLIKDNTEVTQLLERLEDLKNAGKTKEALLICRQIFETYMAVGQTATDDRNVFTSARAAGIPEISSLVLNNIEKYREMFDGEAEEDLNIALESMDGALLNRFMKIHGFSSYADRALEALIEIPFEAGEWRQVLWLWEQHRHTVSKLSVATLCRVAESYAMRAQLGNAVKILMTVRYNYPDAAIMVDGKKVSAVEYLGRVIRNAPRDLGGTVQPREYLGYGRPYATKGMASDINLKEAKWADSVSYPRGHIPCQGFTDKQGNRHRMFPWEIPDGDKYAFAGKRGWKVGFGFGFVANDPPPHFTCPFNPATFGDKMVISNGLKVFCYSVSTGKLLWVYDNYTDDFEACKKGLAIRRPEKFPFVMIMPETNSVIALIENGDIIRKAAQGDGDALKVVKITKANRGKPGVHHGIVCLDLTTGARKWSTEHGGDFLSAIDFQSLPVYDGTTLYCAVGLSPKRIRSLREFWLIALDAKTGSVKWTTAISDWGNPSAIGHLKKQDRPKTAVVPSPPTVLGKTVFVQTNAGLLAAINKDDGTIKWLATYDQTHMLQPPIGQYPVGMTGIHGRLSTQMGNAPAIWGENIYILPDDSDCIYAFDAGCGRLLWKVTTAFRKNGLKSSDGIEEKRMRHILVRKDGTIFLTGNGAMSLSPSGGTNWFYLSGLSGGGLAAEGRAVLFEDNLVIPVGEGLALVDAKTGKHTETVRVDLDKALRKRAAELIPLILGADEKTGAAAMEAIVRCGEPAAEVLTERAKELKGDKKVILLMLAKQITIQHGDAAFARKEWRPHRMKTLAAANGRLILITARGEILIFDGTK